MLERSLQLVSRQVEKSRDKFFCETNLLPSLKIRLPGESHNRKLSQILSIPAQVSQFGHSSCDKTKTADLIPWIYPGLSRVELVWDNIRVPKGYVHVTIEQHTCLTVDYLSILYRSCQVCTTFVTTAASANDDDSLWDRSTSANNARAYRFDFRSKASN